jgi:hypothetical protein
MILEMGTPDEERNPRMVTGSSANGSRRLLLAWDVPADREEPWRRLLQELSEALRKEEYLRSRRRLGISAESVWLVPRMSGGGMALVYLEALDPERMLRELTASEAPFDSWYSRGGTRKLFGLEFMLDFERVPRAAGGELLFAWRDDVPGEPEASKNSRTEYPLR